MVGPGFRTERAFLADPSVLCFAHRGGAAEAPENTLLAFETAIRSGSDVIETDLRLTADGEIVTLHDADLERTTDGRGRVDSMPLAALQRLDAAHHFSPDGAAFPYRGAGLRVPTLREAVALDSTIRFNVDLKPRDPRLARALWEFIDERRLHDRFLVASHRTASLRLFRRLSGHRVATSAGYGEVLRFWSLTRLRRSGLARVPYDALQVPPRYRGLTVIDERFVSTAHSRGLKVHAYTIDEPAAMRHLAELGVDGLMSDRPELLTRVLRSSRPGRVGALSGPSADA